jgi:hypothetical protein
MKSKGESLEILVAANLREILKDPTIRPTKASSGGAHNTEIGDVNNPKYYIECKNWDKKNISFSLEIWNKLCNSIPLGSTKIPLYIIEHPTGERFVLLGLNDFWRILKNE